MYDHDSKPAVRLGDSRTYQDLIGDFLLFKIDEYAKKGRGHGHFLMSCIENDLNGATSWADGENIDKIAAIAKYLYNQCPAPCWGSKEKVDHWMGSRGMEGFQGGVLCPENINLTASELDAENMQACGCVGKGWDIVTSAEHGAQIQRCDDCSPHSHDDDVWERAIKEIYDALELAKRHG